jgi:hypothetical protein
MAKAKIYDKNNVLVETYEVGKYLIQAGEDIEN